MKARVIGPERRHAFGERVAQALDQLEQRGVDVAPLGAEHEGAPVRAERGFEVAEVLGQARVAERGGRVERLVLLLVVVLVGAERVVDVVHLGDEVGHRELELDQLEVGVQVARTEALLVGHISEDVRDLGDREVTVDEVGRGEWAEAATAVHVLDQRLGDIPGNRVHALAIRAFAPGDPGGA